MCEKQKEYVMGNMISFQEVEEKIIVIQNQQALIDSDVAELYGVETKRVNEAVKNNQEKFPNGYIWDITQEEWYSLRSKFSTLENQGKGQYTKYKPKASTEKGLYRHSTIL